MLTIEAEMRYLYGKSASRRLRNINKLPAIIYGGIVAPIKIELNHDKLWNLQIKTEFYREIITIFVGDKKEKVRVQAVQRHSFKPKLTHIDFIRV